MNDGQPVKIVGGPWPERVGLMGVVVVGNQNVYPWHGRGRDEEVIYIPGDPLNSRGDANTQDGRRWSCAINRSALQVVDNDEGPAS